MIDYTHFKLQIRNIKSSQDFESVQKSLENKDLIKYVFEDGVYEKESERALFSEFEEQKWTTEETDMREISKRYPEMLFILICRNENKHWRSYYLNGFCETCSGHIVYESPRWINLN